MSSNWHKNLRQKSKNERGDTDLQTKVGWFRLIAWSWCFKCTLDHSCIVFLHLLRQFLFDHAYFWKYVPNTWFKRTLEPEFLLTCSNLYNSSRNRFHSRFGWVVTENVTARDVGWAWMSPTLQYEDSPQAPQMQTMFINIKPLSS